MRNFLSLMVLFTISIVLARENLEIISSKRARICLNGRWRFMPAKDERSTTQSSWGSVWVPGSWNGTWRLPGVISRGEGPAWQEIELSSLGRAWYEKTVTIPTEWRNRTILLTLERVSTDAVVFVNGVECGRVKWPYGSVDITKAVEAAREATVRLLVASAKDEAEAENLLDLGNPRYSSDAQLDTRGLIGEVFLESRPQGAYIKDVFIQTSVRRKLLTLEVELTGIREAGEVEIVARILNKEGREEKRFTSKVRLAESPEQKLYLSWHWGNPRLWDYRQPNLYKLLLQIKGKGIDDEWGGSFGFREFWIEGRKFFLNGVEIRLRPQTPGDEWNSCAGVLEVIDAMLDGFLETGYNIIELWPWNHDQRGTTHFRELWCEEADKKGILIMAPALDMAPYITWGDLDHWWKPGIKETYEKRMFAELVRYRNHPSVVIWTTTPNFAGYDWQDQNPCYIGRKNWYEGKNPSADKHWKAIREGIALIKKYDPTRPVLVHHGVYNGDIFAPNTYLNLIPLQEREEWLSYWVEHGDMPYLPIEFGTPLHTTFMRGRDGFSSAVISEPWMTEFCAIYLGRKAYELETDAYRQKIANRYQGDQLYTNWQGDPDLEGAPAFQALQSLFIRNTWRSWRTWGITGGMVPWSAAHGWEAKPGEVSIPFYEGRRGMYRESIPISLLHYLRPEGNVIRPAGATLKEVNGPTLAWIAGPKKAFTSKDHNFFAGEKVEKQVVLINDERKSLSYNFRWEAYLGNVLLAKGGGKGTIKPATTLFLPLEFNLPKELPGEKVDGKIILFADIGQQEHKDEFLFRAFRPYKAQKFEVWLFDPIGETATLLKNLGYTVHLIKDSSPSDLSILVVGRKVLSRGYRLPLDLENFLKKGGRVLIMAQEREWMKNCWGFRVAHHLSRRVFPVEVNHPVIKGLDEEDLRDWRGESKLVEAYPEYPLEEIPSYGWHWGNRGVVTSIPIEKPHRGGWRPILECEFDLAYTPLMELEYGEGLLILSTLDLEDHALVDPASNKLAHQLLEYLHKKETSPSNKTKSVIYIGGERGAKLLDFLGVDYEKAKEVKKEAGLVIVDAEADVTEDSLREYIERGGKVLFLARGVPTAPFGVKLERRGGFHGSLDIPPWKECRGLSSSDTHWRADYTAWLIKEGCEVGADGLLGRLKLGKGVAIYSQIDPFRFNSAERVINGNFLSGLSRWTLGQYGTAKAEITIDRDVPEVIKETILFNSVRIKVSQASDQAWHIQFRQPVGSIEKGKTYFLSFWAKADRVCRASLALIMDHEPFNIVDFVTSLELRDKWQNFQFRINATTNERVRIEFQLALQPAIYWFTGISFRPEGEDNFQDIVAAYFRFTRWRETRALSQILANLGVSFESDRIIFHPMPRSINLAGKWQMQMTLKLPSATLDKRYSDEGLGEKAKELVGENPPNKGWQEVNVPGLCKEFREWDGEAVFRCVVNIPPEWAGRALVLSLGPIDDFDDTFFNGELVGRTDSKAPNWWSAPRIYIIPGRLTKVGENILAVRVFDNYGEGGFGGKSEEMTLRLKEPPFPVDFYHPDYRSDFPFGDDPYRYYRW